MAICKGKSTEKGKGVVGDKWKEKGVKSVTEINIIHTLETQLKSGTVMEVGIYVMGQPLAAGITRKDAFKLLQSVR